MLYRPTASSPWLFPVAPHSLPVALYLCPVSACILHVESRSNVISSHYLLHTVYGSHVNKDKDLLDLKVTSYSFFHNLTHFPETLNVIQDHAHLRQQQFIRA